MKLNFTVDMDDIFQDAMEEEVSVSKVLGEAVVFEARKALVETYGGEQIKKLGAELSEKALEGIEAAMRKRVDLFMSEEIVLTDRWGKKNFVGSIEDLMKQKFDEAVIFPVDSYGKRLSGCTSSSQTYVEWMIKKQIDERLRGVVESATKKISDAITSEISKTIENFKDKQVKEKVASALSLIVGNVVQ